MIPAFVTFDVMSFTTPLRRFLPVVAVVVAVAVLAPLPALSILVAAALMVLLAPQTFATDERGRLDTLYATLPISRREVVAGRYIALVVMYLGLAALATVAAITVVVVQGRPVPIEQLGVINAAGLAFFLLSTAVQLPVFFSLGFSRARPMMYLPLVAGTASVWLVDRLGLRERVDLEALDGAQPAVVVALVALALVAAVTLSAALAAARYARRSL